MSLPDYLPVNVEYIEAPEGYIPNEIPLDVVYPKISKLNDKLVLDWYRNSDNKIMLKVWKKEDHPSLKLIPTNAPRSVKSIYKANYQLRLLRMVDTSTYNDILSAQEAWEKFTA